MRSRIKKRGSKTWSRSRSVPLFYAIRRSTLNPQPSPLGFTLVELLVVIAVIGILAALLLPVLSRSKITAQNIACLNNLKQLELCWHLYAADNNDFLVSNNSIYNMRANGDITGMSWIPDLNARTEIDPSNIVNGLLFQYNKSLAIYHCPADQSTLETETGQPLLQLRWRSYNMSQSVNGWPDYDPLIYQLIPAWAKYTAIRHPIPSQLFVFIDENADSIMDSQFGNPPIGNYWDGTWWDMPSDRHNQGANLSFADGHVEHWRWVAPKKYPYFGVPVTPEEGPDYDRIQNAMKQYTDN